MVDDADLIERLESLQASIDGLREDTRKKNRTNRRAITASVLIAVFGVIVGTWGVVHGIHADNSRKQRTVAACQQANQSTNDKRDDDKKTWHFVIDGVVADQSQAKAAKKAIDKQLTKTAAARQRDCSPAGLNVYYAPKNTTKGTKP